MSARFEHLYHLAEAANVASIFRHGLMSTAKLVERARTPEPQRSSLLRAHRTDCVRLSTGVLIRDQKPMPPDASARALDADLEPADWYALLNGRRKPARRDRNRLVPYATRLRRGWSSGRPHRAPVEVLFACVIPVVSPYLLGREQV